MGDVKMMLMAGAFLGAKADIADNFRRLGARKHPGNHRNRGAAQGFRLRIALWDVSRDGGAAGGFFRNADCILVSGTAGGAMMARAHLTERGM